MTPGRRKLCPRLRHAQSTCSPPWAPVPPSQHPLPKLNPGGVSRQTSRDTACILSGRLHTGEQGPHTQHTHARTHACTQLPDFFSWSCSDTWTAVPICSQLRAASATLARSQLCSESQASYFQAHSIFQREGSRAPTSGPGGPLCPAVPWPPASRLWKLLPWRVYQNNDYVVWVDSASTVVKETNYRLYH